jgi:cytochrome c-type biogenesis protein CcmH
MKFAWGFRSHRPVDQTLASAVHSRQFCLETPASWRVWLFCCLATVCAFWVASTARAQVQSPEAAPATAEVAKRLKTLESELRCLVCQNQTLAESPAGLAGDLRREVRNLVEQGKTDAEVKAFLRARYGDFVLYKPPVDPKTYLLWFGPFALLLVGGLSAAVILRRRRFLVTPNVGDADDAQKRARQMLDDDR